MIKCHLSRMMGERKLKVADVARATGVHRNTISALYYERASRIDIGVIDALCEFFECKV
ncbi:MAG: XRE family transcriptional regulator, partial [Phototrophicales bacterium]